MSAMGRKRTLPLRHQPGIMWFANPLTAHDDYCDVWQVLADPPGQAPSPVRAVVTVAQKDTGLLSVEG